VEQGKAPQELIAAKYEDDFRSLIDPQGTKLLRTRPLCPYPQVARWKGSGSTDVAENFACVAPPK
jgi:feruloyl esterase